MSSEDDTQATRDEAPAPARRRFSKTRRVSKWLVGSIAALLCIGYALIVAWGGYQYVMKMHTVGILMQDMPVAQWIPRLVLPAGFLLLAFRFSQVLWKVASGRQGRLLGDEVEDALKLVQEEPSAGDRK